MIKTVTRKTIQRARTTAMAAAMVSAGLLVALAGTPREAEATFAGEDGKIVFASNLTNDPAGDFTPDWQPVKRRY